MFGLLSRPSRRPLIVRRNPASSMLRVEALESRTNPSAAAPVLANLSATWSNSTHVVVTGQVIDQNPSAVWVNGGGKGAAFVDSQGSFRIAVTTDGIHPIQVQAEDTQTQFSADMLCAFGTAPVVVTATSPVVDGVTISKDGNTWHIHGQLNGNTGLDTLISIIGSNPDLNGETVTINADGSFDIGITLNPGSPGGVIGIVAINGSTGETTDVLWEGSIS